MGSVDPGYGTAFLARVVGEKKAREMWYLCRRYSGQEAVAMGLANVCVPHDQLDAEVQKWGEELCERSPTAIAIAKRSFNMDTAHQAGIAGMGMYALKLYYDTEESKRRRQGAQGKAQARIPQISSQITSIANVGSSTESYRRLERVIDVVEREAGRLNPYLDDDLVALADQVRRFATDRIAPGFQERDRTRVLDRAIMQEMGAMGFIAPELPEEFGGLGPGLARRRRDPRGGRARRPQYLLYQSAGFAERPDSRPITAARTS